MVKFSSHEAGGLQSDLWLSPWEPGRHAPCDVDDQDGLLWFLLKKENKIKTDVVRDGTRPTERHVRGWQTSG